MASQTPSPVSSLPTEDALQSLRRLQDHDDSVRLRAIHELSRLETSSLPILQELERIAMDDPVDEVRRAAVEVLDNSVHRQVYGSWTTLTSQERAVVLRELRRWSDEALIPPARADVVGRRYSFDIARQPEPPPAEAPAAPVQPSPSAAPPPPPAPRPSLMQSLFSETSINVALYLGAFFVIGAALVLSALVEAARLPILTVVTALFGVTSLLLERRLPRPSFVLFVVFSTLIPIDAGVIANQLRLEGTAAAAYWGVVFMSTAALWAFSTHHFVSRLLSLAAFVSLELSALSFGRLAAPAFSTLVLCSLAAMGGILGAAGLARWRGQAFALPLLILVQFTEVLLLSVGLLFAISRLASATVAPLDWIWLTAVWVIGAVFFLVSDRHFPFELFPFAAGGALVPIVFTALNAVVEPASPAQWLANYAWGVGFIVASELLYSTSDPARKRFAVPALLGSAAALSLSLVLAMADAFEQEVTTPIFIVLAGIAAAYGGAHWARPRWYVWSAALAAGTAAWFLAFTLPFLQGRDIFGGYVLAGASLVLMGIDLALPRSIEPAAGWHWPPRLLGWSLTSITAFTLVVGWGSGTQAVAVFTAFTAFFTAYALRWDPRIGYAATASFALTATFWAAAQGNNWLAPLLTALSLAYFLGGLILRRVRLLRWADVLKYSAFVLGGLTALVILLTEPKGAGWYVLGLSLLYLLELYLNNDPWAEFGVLAGLALAFGLLFNERNVPSATYYAAGAGMLLLALDLVFERTREVRPDQGITARVLGGLAVASAVLLMLVGDLSSGEAALVSFSLAAYFAVMAYLRMDPRLGYLPTSFLTLSAFFALEYLDRTLWPWPLIILATAFYAVGNFLQRDWGKVLRISGLGLGVLVSLGAWLEGTGVWSSLPVAVAATLFAAEALQRRNAWLALPANGLYLAAYFMVLMELQVDEPQFYSVAVAALGLLMHYLLLRPGSRTGAFVIGFTSQLVLLGTTYVQMVMTSDPVYFTVLFLQSLVVLAYGVVIRSRSLVIAPIALSTLGVVAVVYGLLRGMSVVILIGCTGMLLILLGSTALFLRERVGTWRRRMGEWNA